MKENEGGYLIIKKPWPGMMRTIHGNSERYLESYWEYITFKGEKNVYFAGDGARIDEDGYIWIMGRVDDVISVSGHRLGTMEIESALVSHESVAESAVVGKKDDLKDDDIYWCTADVGWITGHSYIVYGPLSNGATTLMYEGVPRPSNLGAFWEIVQKYKVSIFYTAPTAIRAFMKSGREIPDKYNLELSLIHI